MSHKMLQKDIEDLVVIEQELEDVADLHKNTKDPVLRKAYQKIHYMLIVQYNRTVYGNKGEL